MLWGKTVSLGSTNQSVVENLKVTNRARKHERESHRKMIRSLVGIFGFLILISCDSKTVFNQTEFLDGHWGDTEVVEFELPQLDSLKRYNVFVNIRNSNDYKYNNLFLIVSMNFPHGKTIVDTLEYRMANADGTWIGTGIGNIKDNKLWYKEGVRFVEDGVYTLDLSHAMRDNGKVEGVKNLDGIVDVGVSIEEVPDQNLAQSAN